MNFELILIQLIQLLNLTKSGEDHAKKVEILLPLDASNIPGVDCKDAPIPDYKLVFEESINLAKALDAEVVLRHVASREDEESIQPSNEAGSDRFYSPKDLEDLKETGHIATILR